MSSERGSNLAGDGSEDVEVVAKPGDTSSEYSDHDGSESSSHSVSNRETRTTPRYERSKSRPTNLSTTKLGKKSKALLKFYSSQYLDLFNSDLREFENGEDGVPSADLFETQLGAVHWLPSEKERFFNALSRKGRLNAPKIAALVGRSELEIRDYLLFLGEKEAERHLFEKQTKRVSHLDIPSAIEIGGECERALDQAANALADFQDRYDTAVAGQRHPEIWLIDSEVAGNLDEVVLSQEEDINDSEDAPIAAEMPAKGLFCLATWLELSERFFMNSGPPRLQENWHSIASEDEQPAVTFTAFSDFHDLAVSITRKIMQTAIFLALSRIKSTKNAGYDATAVVKEQDVFAALEILDMTSSMSDFLLGIARRNNLKVIFGSHDKTSRKEQVMSYDEVEKDVSEWKQKWHSRRPVSASRRSSMTSETSAFGPEDLETTALQENGSVTPQDNREAFPSPDLLGAVEMDDIISETDVDGDDPQADEYGGLHVHPSTSLQKRRHAFLEYQQDRYMEEMDRLKGEQEEEHLLHMLGREHSATIKREIDDDLGIRPKTLRKTKEELEDWQGTYYAEWEATGQHLPDSTFLETGRKGKRHRSEGDPDEESQEGRPRKSRVLPIRSIHSQHEDESD